MPEGVVTVMRPLSVGSNEQSMRYPSGRKVLKPVEVQLVSLAQLPTPEAVPPCMRLGWPRKRVETRWMTPGVSMLEKEHGARRRMEDGDGQASARSQSSSNAAKLAKEARHHPLLRLEVLHAEASRANQRHHQHQQLRYAHTHSSAHASTAPTYPRSCCRSVAASGTGA